MKIELNQLSKISNLNFEGNSGHEFAFFFQKSILLLWVKASK